MSFLSQFHCCACHLFAPSSTWRQWFICLSSFITLRWLQLVCFRSFAKYVKLKLSIPSFALEEYVTRAVTSRDWIRQEEHFVQTFAAALVQAALGERGCWRQAIFQDMNGVPTPFGGTHRWMLIAGLVRGKMLLVFLLLCNFAVAHRHAPNNMCVYVHVLNRWIQ